MYIYIYMPFNARINIFLVVVILQYEYNMSCPIKQEAPSEDYKTEAMEDLYLFDHKRCDGRLGLFKTTKLCKSVHIL